MRSEHNLRQLKPNFSANFLPALVFIGDNIPGNSVYINYKAIKDRHGSGVLKLIRSLISQGKRIARHRAHLFFNHSCLRENILTKSLMIKSPINTRAGRKLAEKFGFNCLKLCSLLTLCLLVCVFNFLVFKYGARCVLLLPEEVRPMQRTKRR